jgi:hypothetical protein
VLDRAADYRNQRRKFQNSLPLFSSTPGLLEPRPKFVCWVQPNPDPPQGGFYSTANGQTRKSTQEAAPAKPQQSGEASSTPECHRTPLLCPKGPPLSIWRSTTIERTRRSRCPVLQDIAPRLACSVDCHIDTLIRRRASVLSSVPSCASLASFFNRSSFDTVKTCLRRLSNLSASVLPGTFGAGKWLYAVDYKPTQKGTRLTAKSMGNPKTLAATGIPLTCARSASGTRAALSRRSPEDFRFTGLRYRYNCVLKRSERSRSREQKGLNTESKSLN